MNWRYDNYGTADLLSVSGTTLTVDTSQSIWKSAFYQTARTKCFDIPATDEIWCKFDVYTTDLNKRWRAYNQVPNSNYADGIGSYSDATVLFWSSVSSSTERYTSGKVLTSGTIQTVLLHMVSGSTDGIIEAWLDGVKLYTYTGNVNNGNNFENFFLQSDGAATFFSNVIISDSQIGLNENANICILFDTKRKIIGNYSYTQWVQPVLTSNDNNNALIVSSGGGADSTAYKAFDSSTSNYVNRMNSGAWIQFVTDALIEIRGITVSSPDNCLPRAGILQISYDDGTTWQNVGTWTDILATGTTADVVFDGDYPVGNYFRLLSQGKSLASGGNADVGNVAITAFTLEVSNDFTFDFDTNRNISNIVTDNFDTDRNISNAVTVDFDTCRQVNENFSKDLTIDFDTDRNIFNSVNLDFDTCRNVNYSWRYENYGTADLLSVEGNTLVNEELITKDQSIFKSAFVQTNSVKCFDIPPTNEIWCKFDVYSNDLSVCWFAYNRVPNSAYCDGIRSYLNGGIYFLSSNSDSSVTGKRAILSRYTRHTVLLHMVSGSSDGVIEAWLDGDLVDTYTGNVNNGNLFEDFFLRSEGGEVVYDDDDDEYYLTVATMFSNVIISNQQIGFNENAVMDFDTYFDALRRAYIPIDFEEFFDTKIQSVQDFSILADTTRQVVLSIEPTFDTYREVFRTLDLKCDTLRQIPHNVTITPVENGLPINTPQTDGIQSIEINISAGSLVDQLSIVTVNNIDILDAVRGQYLDYVYEYRVESFSKRGILSTCKCCSSLDNLLYTQISYTLQKITWNGGLYTKDSDDNSQTSHPMLVGDFTITPDVEVEKKTVSASSHVRATASRLKLTPVMLFDDFQSTVDIEQEGVTYQDILNEVFDWSNRVPHKQINCYIRGNYLYVIERGHEQFTYDLDSAHVGKDFSVQKQLIRTSFGVTRKTSDLEKNAGIAKKGYWEVVLGNEIPDEEPEEPEEETPKRNLPSHVQTKNGDVTTDIWYTYDSDGNITRTITQTVGGDIDTRVEVYNSYTTRNGEKLLSSEHTEEYERQDGGWEKVNDKFVKHTYTTVGQQHVSSVDKDGSVNGSVTTPARRDDRPTAFDDAMNHRYLQGTLFEGVYYVERDGHIFVGGINTDISMYTYENGKKVEVVGFIYHPNEFGYETGTLEQVLLYDSSFPVNDAKAQSITNALKWLNRKIQETVTLDVYDQLHVFDLNDKIIFQGNTYFLQSNTVTKTPNIVNKQSLTLVRWY